MSKLFSKLFAMPLGLSPSPYGNFKFIAPAVAAAAITAGAKLADSFVGASSHKSTNKLNYKIWQEQLAAQREQYEKEKAENRFLVNQQRQWSLADRAYENSYNSPERVKQRLLAAGINPAFAMENGAGLFGSATAETSTGSAPTSSVPGAPVMQPIDYQLGAGISMAALSYYQAKQSMRDDYALAADIEFRNRKSIVDYMNAMSDAVRAGVSKETLAESKRQFDENLTFERSKFNQQMFIENDRVKLEQERLQLEELKTAIQKNLSISSIRLDASKIAELAQSIKESHERIFDLRRRGVSDAKIAEEERRIKGYTADHLMKLEGRYDRQNSGNRRKINDFVDWLYDVLPTRVFRSRR